MVATDKKKLLILGGSNATLDVVKLAKTMGIYTIAVDDRETGAAKEIADENYLLSTTDFDGIKSFISQNNINGLFTGPAEFNIRNMIRACAESGLRCYAEKPVWDRCSDKEVFKDYCIKNRVDAPKRYYVTDESSDEELDELEYPVMIKPSDGHASIGITICPCKEEFKKSYKTAMESSVVKRVVVEQYIDNGGAIFGARYIVKEGKAVPYLLIDTYVQDPGKRMMSAVTLTPSRYSKYYMENMDQYVRNMIADLGIRNGVAFFQGLPYNGKIYFHEMGFRLSGGMLYKLTKPLLGINDMQMMIDFAVGNEICSDDVLEHIDVVNCNGKMGAQLMITIEPGTVGKIEGVEEAKTLSSVVDCLQYFTEGQTQDSKYIGTLVQLFARFTLVADTAEELIKTMKKIQETVKVWSVDGELMTKMKFDFNRIVS